MRIIINADDFGKSPERNHAIDDSFTMDKVVRFKHLLFNKGIHSLNIY